MDDRDLTVKQKAILEYIHRETERRGYPPSVREIGEAFRLRSTSTVHGHLSRLARKGYIRHDPSKPRAIEILRPAPGTDVSTQHPESGPAAWVPLVGRVTAGRPILAVENIEDWLPIERDLHGEGQTFALRVRGDSMIGAGILDGDIVIVRRQETADNGSIVVALIDDEATVKRLYREERAVRLQAENDAYPPIITSRATILGKVIALFRRFPG